MVYFVGAGPGDPDMITVKGRRLLEKADIIIYAGSLVSAEHLAFSKTECSHYNSAVMTLEEVINIIETNRSLEIVRLHTGDPSIYGAIREQMDALDKLKIEYEVVPGVSSFTAAAAAVKKEIHPARCQSNRYTDQNRRQHIRPRNRNSFIPRKTQGVNGNFFVGAQHRKSCGNSCRRVWR